MSNSLTNKELNTVLAGNKEQIQQLLHASYNSHSSNPDTSIAGVDQLLQIINELELEPEDSLAQRVKDSLPPSHSMDNRDSTYLLFCDHFSNEYTGNNDLHYSIKQALKQLRKNMARAMLTQHLWPWLTHPNLQKIFQQIHQHCIGWSPLIGRAAERFCSTLTTLLEAIAASDSEEHYTNAIDALEEFFKSENKRIHKLEQRLQDAEKGSLLNQHAQNLSAKTINQLLPGNQLPEPIYEFLHGPLLTSLRLIILNSGENSTEYTDAVDLLKNLVWSFQPISDEDTQRQQVYQCISDLSTQLREMIIAVNYDTDLLENQLILVEKEHLKILKGQELEYAPIKLVENTDPLLSASAVVSKGLIQQVNLLNEGQWFSHQNQEHAPIKLTLKLDEAQQLLFTNYLGVKVESYSFEEFAYKLSSKVVKVMETGDTFTLTGESLVTTLYEDYQNKKQHQAAVYAKKQLKLKQKLQEQELAKAAAVAKARKAAEAQQQARIQAEKKALFEEQQRRKLQAQQNQSGKSSTDIERINIGAVLAFYNELGDCQELKLAVKLQSTGKYIFADKSGIKREERLKDELVEMIAEGSVKIIDEGAWFEDSLEKVVNGLRKGRNK